MTAIARILAATDLSAPARHAVQRAAIQAAACDAGLDLLHVVETGAMDSLRQLLGVAAGELDTRIRDQSADALRQLAEDIATRLGRRPATHVAEGRVLSAIMEHVEATDADLVVLGTQGANFMRHWVLGATAERLLRKTARPILAVRQMAREPYDSVLVPVDFSAWSDNALALARAIAPGARLVLMHAYQVPFESHLRLAGIGEDDIQGHREAARRGALEKLDELATRAGLGAGDVQLVAAHGPAVSRILEQAEERDADLIVLGKHGAGMVEELLLGSVTKHVLADARQDVLIAQPH